MKVFLLFFLFQSLLCAYGDSLETENSPLSAPSLELLRPYLDNQTEFERRIRAFDKLQVGLAQSKYQEAMELEHQGNTAAAAAASEEARKTLDLVKEGYELGLSHFEKSPFLHNYYGELIHDFFNSANKALKHWLRSVEIDERFARAHCNLGMYYFHTGMYSLGLEHMNKALALEPDNADFLFNMVQVYLTHFRQIADIRKCTIERVYEEAMKMSERAAVLGPKDFQLQRDHAFNFFVAERFGITPDWEEAAAAWNKARMLARSDDERFNTLLYEARAHVRANNKLAAKNCLLEAQSLMPQNELVQNLLDSIADGS